MKGREQIKKKLPIYSMISLGVLQQSLQRNLKHIIAENLKRRINESFNFEATTVVKVSEMIMRLKNGKSTAVDCVSSRLLKAGATVLSLHLSCILNCSLKTGEESDCWTYKRIVSIYKVAGSEMHCGNYRPISLQPVPFKILEQFVNEQLQNYLARLNLFKEYL